MRRHLTCCLVLAACTGAPSGGLPTEPPAFDEVERIVTVGDNVGSNPSYARSYLSLLAQNDDALFPMFVGADWSSAIPGAALVRLDRGGDSYAALAGLDAPVCRCDAACGEPCVDPEDERPTLLIVELGVNDLVATALAMLNDEALREDLAPAVEAFRSDVAAVLAVAADRDVFPTPPLLLVTNVPDPTDGAGDLADLVTAFFPFPGADAVTSEMALDLIASHNAVIAEEGEAVGATVVDLHAEFLGHGYHHDDEANPHHDADDPTRWFGTVIDPNLRGAHEIRRMVWRALTGESIDAIPTGLPVEGLEGLPDVPDDGWTAAVVDAAVTAQLEEEGTSYPNVALDPAAVIGAPDGGGTGIVALGVLGAWMVLDLGEGQAAVDGDGEDLVVLEFGVQSGGGTPEPYRVLVADDPEGPWVQLGDAFGERAFDLGPAGVARARYVRIESLAQTHDVLHGLGSPYYPGPEFDAVGAVFLE